MPNVIVTPPDTTNSGGSQTRYPSTFIINRDGSMSAGGDPAASFSAVTKSDSTVLTGVRALYIGTTGDVVVRSAGSSTSVTFKAVPAGAFVPVQAEKVMAATTAADIVALY